MSYRVNEVFHSIQGEGVRAGTANVFVRFSGCNLSCRRETEGFDCDTEFVSGRNQELDELVIEVARIGGECRAVIFTGGEPSLQLNEALVEALHERGYYLAIETNGTNPLPPGLDWVCVSPKTAEHTLRVAGRVDEVKYVRHAGQALPRPSLDARHYLISPAVQPDGSILRADLEHCIALVKGAPSWRLSIQLHKFLAQR